MVYDIGKEVKGRGIIGKGSQRFYVLDIVGFFRG